MVQRRRLNSSEIDRVKDTPSLTDAAYQAIREAIANSTLEPGDWLREIPLAEELGVSRVTMRTALSRLVAEGLAVRVPHKGVRVAVLPLEELEDIYEMRILLEGRAVELAAERITAADLERMRELLQQETYDLPDEGSLQAQEKHREFHWIAIRASGRRQLSRVLGQLLDLTLSYLTLRAGTANGSVRSETVNLDFGQIKDLFATSVCEHALLLQAFEERDPEKARQAIVQHLQRTLDWLKASRGS